MGRRFGQRLRRCVLQPIWTERLRVMVAFHQTEVNAKVVEIRKLEKEFNHGKMAGQYPDVISRKGSAGQTHRVVIGTTQKFEQFVYHGTSLGIARVWAVRGFMGGMKGVTEALDVDQTEPGQKKYFCDPRLFRRKSIPSFHRKHGPSMRSLPSTLYELLGPGEPFVPIMLFVWLGSERTNRAVPFYCRFLFTDPDSFAKDSGSRIGGSLHFEEWGTVKPVCDAVHGSDS